MKLYLSSYKLGEKTQILKQWIKEHDDKIIFIANSRDAKEQNEKEKNKIEQRIGMLCDIGFEVKHISLKDYFGNKVVDYLDKNNIKYKTLKDGEVIIEN